MEVGEHLDGLPATPTLPGLARYGCPALPICPPSAVLLSCNEGDGPHDVLAALRERLAESSGEAAVLAADVDGLEDVAAMRELLRQAQAAMRRRQP